MNTKIDTGEIRTVNVDMARRQEKNYQTIEMAIWTIASILVAGGIIFRILVTETSPVIAIIDRYPDFLLALVILLFPLIYRLTFGTLPLEAFRRRRAQRQLEDLDRPSDESDDLEIRGTHIQALPDAKSANNLTSSSANTLFAYYADDSRQLSKSIYNRAGVYLMVGVIVAFSGLVFFYSQTTQNIYITTTDGLSLLITLAPKFGILFFIELIAFFFLRQYRSAMDEFRYYEAIKRSREETFALIKIANDGEKPFNPIELVKAKSFFSNAGVLDNGQSTEILESRKLEKNELELLERVIEVVSRNKK
ncbi:hypothetical protein D0C27_11265 [Alcaligenes faecalis]|uniref:hypothetical protein n=1 Tax=Alcaligenes faecalis TaxID=511 RepID=UPI0010CA2B4E|nr:hypothetical protein [Alcaligenes faecalis]QCP82427.1 hypothetical protein D0C27_11265 [Alcaligenes faecalis]